MERRFYQRIPVQVSAMVTTGDGVCIKVVVIDVSIGGLSVECNIRQRNMLTPGGSFVRDGRPVSVFVELNLSNNNDESLSKIVARCHVIFSRRMSSDHCKIGLRYADIDNNGHEQLVRFMAESLVTS
ncbi:MAG: PilZ domain-containing protein [Methylobacter sp.]|nr:PilZ domain-containing protein [Methylobacter sp.]